MSSAHGKKAARAEGGANALNNASLKSVSNLVKLPKSTKHSKKGKAQSARPGKYIMYPLEYKGKQFEIHITPGAQGSLKFVVKKPGNDTPCVTFTYTPNDKSVYLDYLLFGVQPDDECRNEGTNGPFYLSLIFNILKGCFKPYKIRKFTLTDAASIPSAAGIDNPSLSAIKLLTDSRTFYEGYGFLPVFETNVARVPSKAYLALLKAYLIDRHEILTNPIDEIIPKLRAREYFKEFPNMNQTIFAQEADIIDALNSILRTYGILSTLPNLAVPADMVLSLSGLFNVMPNVDISGLSAADTAKFNTNISILRRTIYYIVNTYMDKFRIHYASYVYYCGERDSDFYDPIQAMYESINGNRREVYARYLNRPFRPKKETAAAAANTDEDVNIELLPNTIAEFEALRDTEMPTDAELTMDALLGQAMPSSHASGASSASAARPNNRRSRKVNNRQSQQQVHPLRLSNLQSGMQRLSMAPSPSLNNTTSRPRPIPAPRRFTTQQPTPVPANNNRAAAIAALSSLQRPRPQPPARY